MMSVQRMLIIATIMTVITTLSTMYLIYIGILPML